ncbi:hypothetical protein D3C78_19220 [compost metagenome]
MKVDFVNGSLIFYDVGDNFPDEMMDYVQSNNTIVLPSRIAINETSMLVFVVLEGSLKNTYITMSITSSEVTDIKFVKTSKF